LNLLVAAIILWNTVYLQRAIDYLRGQDYEATPSDLAHLSPLGWEHINLTGDYHWETSPTLGPDQFRPLQPAQANPAAKGSLLLGVLLAVITVGGISTTWHKAEKPSSQPTSESISQPAPTPQPAPPVVAPAPRATLVKLPAPRAELVRLPEWRIGEQRDLLMPNGLKVLGTLKGRVPSPDLLPSAGNAIGDAWLIGEDIWVFVVAPNEATATWIDP
jgi:hypothetical protein